MDNKLLVQYNLRISSSVSRKYVSGKKLVQVVDMVQDVIDPEFY